MEYIVLTQIMFQFQKKKDNKKNFFFGGTKLNVSDDTVIQELGSHSFHSMFVHTAIRNITTVETNLEYAG